MQGFDATTIRTLGIPGILLMENAGRAFVDALAARAGPLPSKRAVVVCGKGSNGGDGFVIARHLLNRGCSVEVVVMARSAAVKGDARTNLDALRKLARVWKGALRITDGARAKGLDAVRKGDIVVDALFGTGFRGGVQGLERQCVDWMNGQPSFIASVDIPSGVSADNGTVENVAVKAALTVTMGLAKIGHFVGQGAEHSGEVVVADISIPRSLFHPPPRATFRVQASDVASVLPRRPLQAHKYSVGKVFVLAGSRNFTGAPCMCSLAAMRGGAGAVILGVPSSIQPVLARKLTEVIIDPLEETAEGTLAPAALNRIRERARWADVVAIGPGLSRNGETDGLILKILEEIPVPIVLDADGLTAAASSLDVLRRRKGETILTPHAGELSRLTRIPAADIERDRVAICRQSARNLRSILVLKGAPTVTADRAGDAYVNATGNPGMATIGSGDVLTGLIASLLAQGMEAAAAAYAGVYVHGLAGDLAATRFGTRSLLALDLVDHLSSAYLSLAQ